MCRAVTLPYHCYLILILYLLLLEDSEQKQTKSRYNQNIADHSRLLANL